jgi:hypothetical protein
VGIFSFLFVANLSVCCQSTSGYRGGGAYCLLCGA